MMETIKLNETPVRTSRNFNINNIKLNNIYIPENIREFNNIEIVKENSGIKIEENVNNNDLTHGLGKILTNQIKEKANKKIKFIIKNQLKKEVKVVFGFDRENNTLIDNIEILAEENARAIVIIKYEMKENIEAYHNGRLKILAKRNSEVNVIFVNFMNTISNNFIAIENILDENAKVNYTMIDFGGKNSITNYYSNLLGKNSENKINTIYLGKENQMFDLNYIAELRGEKTNIDIEVQGAIGHNAKKHFKGTIDFKKGCKKAHGNENENCILLSNTAKSIALPMLLCSEEEVEGNHSSSAGKVGEKELFYIMSRGFNQKEAMKLLVRAKFNQILENISNKELKKEILDEIDRRLD